MKQGKFEAGRRAVKPEEEGKQSAGRRRPDWLLFAVPVLVLAALAAIFFVGLGREQTAATEPVGLTMEETMEMYRRM